jgi:hypothetical protein
MVKDTFINGVLSALYASYPKIRKDMSAVHAARPKNLVKSPDLSEGIYNTGLLIASWPIAMAYTIYADPSIGSDSLLYQSAIITSIDSVFRAANTARSIKQKEYLPFFGVGMIGTTTEAITKICVMSATYVNNRIR